MFFMANSPKFKLNHTDMKKVGKGAIIAILGAILTYGSDIILNIDFGDKAVLVGAIWSVLVNFCWKWISNNQTK
jgi:hypothetical protein